MIRLLLALLLLLAAPAASAPADEGQRAFDARRYAEARRLWTAPAEAGDAQALLGLGQIAEAGRDAAADLPAAATLYARAAVRGSARAAYRLGRLYAAGTGLPRNPEQAEAWFAAGTDGGVTPTPRERTALRRRPQLPAGDPDDLIAAQPVAPAEDAALPRSGDEPVVELVWIAPAQRAGVRFFVEVVAIEDDRQRDVFAGYSDRSALLAALDPAAAEYAWRVFVVGLDAPDYIASSWIRFRVVPP